MEDISFEKIIKTRCIQVEENPPVEYIDYHKYNEDKDNEELDGASLVKSIVDNSFPPISN